MSEIIDYLLETERARNFLSSQRPVPAPIDSARHITACFGKEFKSTVAGKLCVMMIKEESSYGVDTTQEPTTTTETILDVEISTLRS